MLMHQPWREAQEYHRAGWWRDETLPDLLAAAAAARPDAAAVTAADGTVVSWARLRAGAARLARELAAAGARGRVVVISLPDGPHLLAASVAVQAAGGITAPLAASAGDAEIAAVADRTSAVAVITRRELDPDDHTLWDAPVDGALFPDGDRPDPDRVADIMFTSGTTGRPKGVMNTANTKLCALRGFVSAFDLTERDVWGLVAPMSHNAGWLYTALPALITGAASVVVGRGDPKAMLDRLERSGVTCTFLVPTHVVDLVTAYRRHPGRWDLKLRFVVTGAAPSSAGMLAAVRDEWGATPISMYGMTETQGNTFTRPGDPIDVISSTVGQACPGTAVALRDPATGALHHPGETGATGEIVTRGPHVFAGYYEDQAATAAGFTADGWFRTGDLGEWVGGSVRVIGRIKDVILRGGQTVAPADVEAAVASFPGIGEFVVVGLPDPRLGERICVAVLGAAPGIDLLRAHLAEHGIGRHLVPDEVRSIDVLPRTDLGKARRNQVRDQLLHAG